MKRPLERLLSEWARLQSPGGRAELGRFTLEGTRLCERALNAGVDLQAALVAESYGQGAGSREQMLLRRLHGLPQLDLHVLPDGQLAKLSGGRTFGAVLGLAALPAPAPLEGTFASRAGELPPGVLVVVNAADPGNVGALLRTALASGARAFLSVGSTDAFHPKAVRTSMGSLFRMPVRHFETTADLFAWLRPQNVLLCGAVARGGQRLETFCNPQARPLALLMGSEAFGLEPADQEALDQRLTIPMPSGVDSLSINAAAAVCLYELLMRAR